jgi:hypothetical protein
VTWQQPVADARGEGHDNGVGTMRVGAIRLHNEHGPDPGLLGALRRRKVGPPNLTAFYCH